MSWRSSRNLPRLKLSNKLAVGDGCKMARAWADDTCGAGACHNLCGNQNFTARSCCIIVSSATPSTRRLLDGVAMPVPHRSTEPGRPRHRREMT